MSKSIGIYCTGFCGDIGFSTSVASPLRKMLGDITLTYYIPLPQPRLLLTRDPAINFVIVPVNRQDIQLHDTTFTIPVVEQHYPATIWMQMMLGIPSDKHQLEFHVYTVPEFDQWALEEKARLTRYRQNVPVVAYPKVWEYRAYQCTKDTLRNGEGAPHRNIEKIIQELEKHFVMVPVGFDRSVDSSHPDTKDPVLYAKTASLLKVCDYMIGPENGLTNLSAGVGTKTIITTDFIAQNYWGPRGRIKQIENPKMGPAVYFPEAGHSHLNPLLTDDQVCNKIRRIIQGYDAPEVFDWNKLSYLIA